MPAAPLVRRCGSECPNLTLHVKLGGVSAFYTPSSSGDAWFRLGRMDVTTTVLVTLLGAVCTVLGAFIPGLLGMTLLVPGLVLGGEVWRLVTWPFVDTIGIWSVLTLAIFWYFGTMVENRLGRRRMAAFLVALWAIITGAHVLAGLVLPGSTVALGLSMFQLVLLLLFIAEEPSRPFFFGIPAWVLGLVIVGLQVLSLISMRNWGALVALALTLALAAVVARQGFGFLSGASWMPSAPRVRRPAPAPRVPTRRERVAQQRHADDEERIDELLGKISAGGLHSLSKKERAELEQLRQRRRRR